MPSRSISFIIIREYSPSYGVRIGPSRPFAVPLFRSFVVSHRPFGNWHRPFAVSPRSFVVSQIIRAVVKRLTLPPSCRSP